MCISLKILSWTYLDRFFYLFVQSMWTIKIKQNELEFDKNKFDLL